MNLTPRRNCVLIRDIPEIRKVGRIHLPDPSTGHQGLIKSMSGWQLGEIENVGLRDPRYSDCPATGSVVLYAHTAGKLIAKADRDAPQHRVIHIDEIQLEVENHDPASLTFL